MKNVARTYFLEHEGEGLLFDQLFKLLNSNLLDEESYRRELASCTGALRTSISQHLFKEAEQVYFNYFSDKLVASFSHLYILLIFNLGAVFKDIVCTTYLFSSPCLLCSINKQINIS